MAVAPGGLDAERRAGRDEGGLERPDERAQQEATLGQRDDRIGDQLAGSVIGHLATTLDPMDLDPAGRELAGRREDVRRVRVAAQGQDRWVLEQQELIGDGAGRALGDESLLQVMSGGVVRATEPACLESASAGADGRLGRGEQAGLHEVTIAGHPLP